MVKLYLSAYTEPEAPWDYTTSEKFLLRCIDNFPKYCLAAIDDKDVCLGAVFCRVDPYYNSKMLWIDSIQVKPEYRKHGVADLLLKELVKLIKEDNFLGIHFIADGRQEFPMNWYKKLGFKESGWVEFEARFEDLNL